MELLSPYDFDLMSIIYYCHTELAFAYNFDSKKLCLTEFSDMNILFQYIGSISITSYPRISKCLLRNFNWPRILLVLLVNEDFDKINTATFRPVVPSTDSEFSLLNFWKKPFGCRRFLLMGRSFLSNSMRKSARMTRKSITYYYNNYNFQFDYICK